MGFSFKVIALLAYGLSISVKANDSLGVIASKGNPLEAVDKAIANLDSSTNEPVSFWAKIIEDKSYSAEHRRKCLLQLFVRHGKAKKLGELILWDTSHHWFGNDKIYVHHGPYFGPSPFGNGTTPGFFCKLFPNLPTKNQSVIFLKFSSSVVEEDLRKAFQRKTTAIDDMQIVAVSAIEILENGRTFRWIGK